MNHNVHVVIMAGGDGKRLWPISNNVTPKQFVDVFGCGRTLIQLTVDRLKTVCPEKNIWVVTQEEYEDLVHAQLPNVRPDHILFTQASKNTAPAIAYVTWKIKSVAPDATIVVSNSDQMVTNYDYFANSVKKSIAFAAAQDAVVVLGIKPDRDEVHGFFQVQADAVEDGIYKAIKYFGKPSPEVASEYLSMPNMYWNTSLLVAKASTFEQTYRKHAPEIAEAYDKVEPYMFSSRESYMLYDLQDELEAISYERKVLAHADNVYVFSAEMGWSDLGTWSDLVPFVSMARYGNLKVGNIKAYNCKNCIIEAPDAKMVVVDGLENFVVAAKDGSILVCRLDNEKMIKEWSIAHEKPIMD